MDWSRPFLGLSQPFTTGLRGRTRPFPPTRGSSLGRGPHAPQPALGCGGQWPGWVAPPQPGVAAPAAAPHGPLNTLPPLAPLPLSANDAAVPSDGRAALPMGDGQDARRRGPFSSFPPSARLTGKAGERGRAAFDRLLDVMGGWVSQQ